MLNLYGLIEFALGKDEAGKVDTSIPQGVFDAQYPGQREQNAGWYYAPEAKLMGRLLTKGECWDRIVHRMGKGELTARIGSQELPAYICAQWTCFRQHVERGEIQLEEVAP
jgi:hypothetical protein